MSDDEREDGIELESFLPVPSSIGSEGSQEEMPDAPVSDGAADEWQEEFEVVLAKNVYPPFRFSQEYYWLAVLAKDERAAIDTASRWVLENDSEFECTDLLRKTTPHFTRLGLSGDAPLKSIPVSWGLPVSKLLPDSSMLRDPVTGIRIGFLADHSNQKKFERACGRRDYRLIIKKPAPSADWVAAAPLVTSLSLIGG